MYVWVLLVGVQTGPGETLEMCLALSDKVIVWGQGGDGGLTAKRHKETRGSDGNVLCLD